MEANAFKLKLMQVCTFFILLLLMPAAGFAQRTPVQHDFLISVDDNEGNLPERQLLNQHLGLGPNDGLRPLRSSRDELGTTHVKYQHYYKNLIVEGSTCTVHAKDGKVSMISGNASPIRDIDVNPIISAADAFLTAVNHVGAKQYRWEFPRTDQNNYEKPAGQLVVLPDPEDRAVARLAYKFDIRASEPLYSGFVYVDAQTGAFIHETNRIHDNNVPASGISSYNGTVNFVADSYPGGYRLQEYFGSSGVQTRKLGGSTNYSDGTDISSPTTSFLGDYPGVEAHWAMEKSYDYYLSKHGRLSYDDNNALIKSYTHYGVSYDNAFWDGNAEVWAFGDGDGLILNTLPSIDVCGHEFTHAVTQYSADLDYSNESGALNESFSDIFGEMIEAYTVGSTDWRVGNWCVPLGGELRSMSNPKLHNNPDTYKGQYWDFVNQEVHNNSGVGNKWFYILSSGANGTNDNGWQYCVPGIGIAKAAKIAYRTLTVYLTSSSAYADARTASVQAAKDLYGNDAQEVSSTANAWYAVGVGLGYAHVVCPADKNGTTNPGICGTTITYATPIKQGNCPNLIQEYGLPSGSMFPGGTTYNQFRVTDVSGADATCSFLVTVHDNQPPTMTCPANIVKSNDPGLCTAIVNFTLPTPSDNCPNPYSHVLIGQNSGSAFPIGTTIITLRAVDIDDNTSTCTFSIIVNDTEKPTISCPGNTTTNTDPGQCTSSLYYFTPVGFDNCGLPTTTLESGLPSGSAFPKGVNLITLRATDASGNTKTCTFSITVNDHESPGIACPANIVKNTDPGQCSAVTTFSIPGATDNCPGATTALQSGPASGSAFPKGVTTITLRATDAASNTNTCSFSVTVSDHELPGIACPANIVKNTDPNQCSAVTTFAMPGATDNCPGAVADIMSGPASGSAFPKGTTVMTLRATDASGNTNTCTFSVTVNDLQAPAVVCPANIVKNTDPGQCSAVTTFQIPVATDNCPGALTIQSAGLASNAAFLLGTSSIVMRATDAAGNSSTCSFTVTVSDHEAPVVVCKNATVALDQNGTGSITAASVFASGSDNCGGVNLQSVSQTAFNCSNYGNNTVTLTVNDGHGNNNTCTATVAVVDNIPPTVTCQRAYVYLNQSGTGSITTASVFQSGSDNCGNVIQQSVTPNAFTCSNLGANTVTLTVSDGHGNTATCTNLAVVLDAIAPTMACRNLTVNLDPFGSATIAPAQINNGSTDNCTIASLSLSQTLFTCANLGNNTIVLTGTDQSGNSATCSAVVTVKDVTPPTMICKNATVQLSPAGTVTVLPATVNNNSSDACGIQAFILTPNTFSCGNIGANAVVLKGTDGSSNSATCTAVITIEDKTPPTAVCKNINVYLDDAGHATITPAQVDGGSTDACGIATRTINNNQFDCGQLGGSPVSVVLTLKDVNNNQATCIAYVTVKDNQAPTAVCDNATVQLNASGQAVVYPGNLILNSFDNCSVWSASPSAKTYNCNNIGTNTLTIGVSDWSGNHSTCTATITVLPPASGGACNHYNGNTQDRSDEDPAVAGLLLYPNPTDGAVTARFNLAAREACQMRLFDLNGRMVLEQPVAGTEGENSVRLELGNLPAGLYLFELQTGNGREQRKLVIQQ